MAVTSTDAREVAFGKAPFGRRGYDEEQVDAFLEEVQGTLASLETEIAGLRAGGRAGGDTAVLAALAEITHRLDRIEASAASRLTPPDPLFGGT